MKGRIETEPMPQPYSTSATLNPSVPNTIVNTLIKRQPHHQPHNTEDTKRDNPSINYTILRAPTHRQSQHQLYNTKEYTHTQTTLIPSYDTENTYTNRTPAWATAI